MWIQVRTMDGKETHTVDSLSRLTKVQELRKKIEELFHVDPQLQRLFYRGKQMEDGHTLFDYDVRLNDTIQLLVRQSLALPLSTKERDSELSDSDSGYGVGQSESDKSSMHGEGAAEGDDKSMWEDTELGLYKVNEYVDVRDSTLGAWFEAQVVQVQKRALSMEEPCTSSAMMSLEDDIMYHIKYDDYPEHGVEVVKAKDVRARARTLVPWQDLEVGQVVMANYNVDYPRKRGFWYDVKICRKRETRTARELYGNVMLGE